MSSGRSTRADATARARSSARLSSPGRSTAAPTMRSPTSWGEWRSEKARIIPSSPTRKMWRDATRPAAARACMTPTSAVRSTSSPAGPPTTKPSVPPREKLSDVLVRKAEAQRARHRHAPQRHGALGVALVGQVPDDGVVVPHGARHDEQHRHQGRRARGSRRAPGRGRGRCRSRRRSRGSPPCRAPPRAPGSPTPRQRRVGPDAGVPPRGAAAPRGGGGGCGEEDGARHGDRSWTTGPPGVAIDVPRDRASSRAGSGRIGRPALARRRGGVLEWGTCMIPGGPREGRADPDELRRRPAPRTSGRPRTSSGAPSPRTGPTGCCCPSASTSSAAPATPSSPPPTTCRTARPMPRCRGWHGATASSSTRARCWSGCPAASASATPPWPSDRDGREVAR